MSKIQKSKYYLKEVLSILKVIKILLRLIAWNITIQLKQFKYRQYKKGNIVRVIKKNLSQIFNTEAWVSPEC